MTDRQMVINALYMWRNHIQTGNALLSTQDAENIGKPELCRMLNSDQQEAVIHLEELADSILNGGSI